MFIANLLAESRNLEENYHHPPAARYLNAICILVHPAGPPMCQSGKFCNLLTSVVSGQKVFL